MIYVPLSFLDSVLLLEKQLCVTAEASEEKLVTQGEALFHEF